MVELNAHVLVHPAVLLQRLRLGAQPIERLFQQRYAYTQEASRQSVGHQSCLIWTHIAFTADTAMRVSMYT